MDEPDILSQLVAQHIDESESMKHKRDSLVHKLPMANPHDDDGYTHSFDLDDMGEIKAFFDKYGYVVIKDILSAREVKNARDEFFSSFDKTDDKSISEYLNRPDNRFARMGIIGINNNLQSLAQLSNRQNENVYKAFSTIYGGEKKLIVDHDRLGAMRPTMQRDRSIKKEWQTVSNWLHLDCNPLSGEISIGSLIPPQDRTHHDFDNEAPFLVQGLLALSDAKEQDGGFVCVPGSHRIAKEWTNLNSLGDKRPQLRPSLDDPLQKRIQCIPVRAGSLVVWNAFTMHANNPNRSKQWRLNQYIRMYPAKGTRFLPFATDPSDYPRYFIEKLVTPLGRKLFGIDSWDDE